MPEPSATSSEEHLRPLLERASNGDVEAFGMVVEALTGDTRALCVLLGVRHAALDDVCQDVFIEAFQNLARYDRERPFRLWLRGLTRNLVKRHWDQLARDRAVRTGLSYDLIAATAEVTLDADSGDDAARIVALRACLQRLPMPQRALLESRYGQDLSAEDIAASSGRPSASIRVGLMRIRRVLHACMREALGGTNRKGEA